MKETERLFSIGQLEAGQEVSFEFMATGLQADEWRLYPYNEEGNVEFRQRDAGTSKDEQAHVRPAATIAILFFLTSTFIQAIEATDFFLNQFVAGIGVLVDLALAIALLPHILPIARIVQRLVTHWSAKPDPTTSVTINGGDARVIASSGSVGTIRLQVPDVDQQSEPTSLAFDRT